jgi:hypothetical protein
LKGSEDTVNMLNTKLDQWMIEYARHCRFRSLDEAMGNRRFAEGIQYYLKGLLAEVTYGNKATYRYFFTSPLSSFISSLPASSAGITLYGTHISYSHSCTPPKLSCAFFTEYLTDWMD